MTSDIVQCLGAMLNSVVFWICLHWYSIMTTIKDFCSSGFLGQTNLITFFIALNFFFVLPLFTCTCSRAFLPVENLHLTCAHAVNKKGSDEQGRSVQSKAEIRVSWNYISSPYLCRRFEKKTATLFFLRFTRKWKKNAIVFIFIFWDVPVFCAVVLQIN